jgi:hypothetical protein
MPAVTMGNVQGQGDANLLHKDLGYEYPNELNLLPGSKLHERLKNEILYRARESANVMSQRFDSWNDIDKILTSYISTDEKEKAIKDQDVRKPVSIVFPYTYAILETLLSYLVAAFFQDPIFRYEGTGPDDIVGAILMEKLVQVQCNKTKVALSLHTMFRDSMSYGMGITVPGWRVTKGFNKKRGLFGDTSEVEEVTLFEGNELTNIDPYLFLPDVNVAVHEVQKGEYCGWVNSTNYMELLSDESNSESDLFNVKYLKGLKGRRTTIYSSDNSARNKKTGFSGSENQDVTFPIDVIYMYIKIIPSEWELGKGDRPELWQFALASDEVIIKARPAGFNHNMIPVTVASPDFDGYSTSPLSRLEMLAGLQGTLDWLFNSHIANVRKAINDMIVVDPFLINIKDLQSPEPGKIIRARRPAWGRGVKDAVQQLAVNDVTRGNIADSAFIVQWMQKISASDDSMMGSLRQGGPERLTGAEFQGTRAGSVSRLERVARVIGLQAMQDIGFFFASHNQQMMKQDTYVKMAGDWQELLLKEYGNENRGRIKVSPNDLDINYDVLIRDGSVPGGNFSGAWIQLYDIMSKNPELAQRFDMVRIFTHIARGLGAKDVNSFVRRGGNIQAKVSSPEDVLAQVQQGNLKPLEGEA